MVSVISGGPGLSDDQRLISCAGGCPAKSNEKTSLVVASAVDIESAKSYSVKSSGCGPSVEDQSHGSQSLCVAQSLIAKSTLPVDANPDVSVSRRADLTTTQSNSSLGSQHKVSKQDTVNKTCSPIFIGVVDEDYLIPSTCTGSTPSLIAKPSQKAAKSESVSSTFTTEAVASISTACTPSDNVPTENAITLKNNTQECLAEAVNIEHSSSASDSTISVVTPPASVTATDKTDQPEIVTSGDGQSSEVPISTQSQPISVNLPDDTNKLTPVRDVAPDPSAAPPVVRLENNTDGNAVPSRSRQLIRGLALCGDDDTRLRPPLVVNNFAPTGSSGFAVRSNQNSSSLSRESSYTDYTSDLNEVELRSFIVATLHKNPRDRALVLELEQIFTDLANNFGEQSIKLPPVSSYNRMIIHRVAVLFGLDHNVDNSGKCVVVSKTNRTKQPDFLFASLIQSNIFTDTKRFYPTPWSFGEIGMGELARRAQSEIGCNFPNAESDTALQSQPWLRRNQRSFERQHFPYYMGFVNNGAMMKKAGSFSGVPTIYQSGNDSFEVCDQSQNMTAYLPARDSIDETVERLSNTGLSDCFGQMNHPSFSNSPTYSGVYPGYPQVLQCAARDEIMCATGPCQQQVFVQPTSVMTPCSAEMYPSQPTVMMPVRPNQLMQQQIATIPCQPDELGSAGQSTQEQTAHLVPCQPEYLHYRVGGSTQNAFPAQYQQVVFPQQYGQLVQPSYVQTQQQFIQPQNYSAAVIQTPIHSQYNQPLIHQQIQPHHQYVSTQSMMQSSSYRQYQPKESPSASIVSSTRHQYVKGVKSEQPIASAHVPCGQWSTEEEYHNCVNGTNEGSLDTERPETRAVATSQILSTESHAGGTLLNPLNVFVQPEPMYHYSQASPVMSSMQQQQMLQIQYHSRPLLYKPTQQYSGQQPINGDGGYFSMNQDSINESNSATADEL